MTLLLREVARFVAEAGLWLLALVLVTGLVAAAIMWLFERVIDRTRILGAVVVGGGVAALAHRVGAEVWAPDVGGRPLPILWAALGAGLVVTVTTVRRRRADS